MELLTGSKVVDVDTETAIVTLEDGSQTTCDLVIGADGIRVSLDPFEEDCFC